MRRSSSPRRDRTCCSSVRSSVVRPVSCWGICLAENGVALRAPQAHQAQIPADRQQPAHGRAGGAILRGVIPHMNEYILRDILCVVGVFQVRQRQTIHRRSGEMVELRQRILLRWRPAVPSDEHCCRHIRLWRAMQS
jgi:hypothetical protein